jgi:hypothetical protein
MAVAPLSSLTSLTSLTEAVNRRLQAETNFSRARNDARWVWNSGVNTSEQTPEEQRRSGRRAEYRV